jgi:hypothetical protein
MHLSGVVVDQVATNHRHVAEAHSRLSPGVRLRHPHRHVSPDREIEVKLNLIIDFGRDIARSNALLFHTTAGSARSTRVTACEYRNHTEASLRRCLRPAWVSV